MDCAIGRAIGMTDTTDKCSSPSPQSKGGEPRQQVSPAVGWRLFDAYINNAGVASGTDASLPGLVVTGVNDLTAVLPANNDLPARRQVRKPIPFVLSEEE